MGHCQGPSRAAVHNHITAMLTPSEAYFASATPWVEEVAPSSLPVAVVVVQHEDLLGQVEEEALGVPVRRTKHKLGSYSCICAVYMHAHASKLQTCGGGGGLAMFPGGGGGACACAHRPSCATAQPQSGEG